MSVSSTPFKMTIRGGLRESAAICFAFLGDYNASSAPAE
jgi:hypothetical protein